MGDLSRNFSRSEFACRCCGKADIDPRLVDALQELRDLANAPIRVSSGYRCSEHNRAVGGAKQSRHLRGHAADIVIKSLSVAGQELKLETAAQDALRHAVAKADPKKTPDGTVTRIVREVLRGFLPLK